MQDSTLQFTHRNYVTIMERRAECENLGVEIYQFTNVRESSAAEAG